MSFGFNAVGTTAECAAQLSLVKTESMLGAAIAEILTEAFNAVGPQAKPHGEYRHIVKATGHSGSGLHLSVTVDSLWVPKVAVELGEVFEEIDEGARAAVAAHAAGDED